MKQFPKPVQSNATKEDLLRVESNLTQQIKDVDLKLANLEIRILTRLIDFQNMIKADTDGMRNDIGKMKDTLDSKFIAIHKEIGNIKEEMGKQILKILGGMSLILAMIKGLEWYLTSSHP